MRPRRDEMVLLTILYKRARLNVFTVYGVIILLQMMLYDKSSSGQSPQQGEALGPELSKFKI